MDRPEVRGDALRELKPVHGERATSTSYEADDAGGGTAQRDAYQDLEKRRSRTHPPAMWAVGGGASGASGSYGREEAAATRTWKSSRSESV